MGVVASEERRGRCPSTPLRTEPLEPDTLRGFEEGGLGMRGNPSVSPPPQNPYVLGSKGLLPLGGSRAEPWPSLNRPTLSPAGQRLQRRLSMRVYYDRDADVNLIKAKKVAVVGFG